MVTVLLAIEDVARHLPNFDALGKHIYTLRTLEESLALVPIVQPGRPNFSICRKSCLKAKVLIGILGL